MATDQTRSSPIINYFEDPSYPRVPDEESRAIVRQWRFRLERLLGLYNAKLIHTCTEECLKPIILDTQTDGDEEERDTYKFVAGPINVRHNLYGCPRSGIVHWCPLDAELRRRACTFRSQNIMGETVCSFSGRYIELAEHEYDRFIDTTIGPPLKNDQQENSWERDARIASGLDKNNHNVAHVTAQEKEEKVRAVFEHQAMQKVNRSLESRHKRRLDRTEQASDQAPRQVSAPLTLHGAVSGATGVSSSSSSHAPAQGTGKRKLRYDAGHSLSVALDTQRNMKRIIIDLIASPDSHAVMHHEMTALDPTHAYIEVYLKRVAKIYALVSKERDLDKQRAHDRNQRGGACVGLSVRELTVTTLYTYARGYNIENQNLIPRDEYLAKLLPIPKHLPWYGIDPIMRQHLLDTNQRLPKNIKIYDESMTTKALVQIQQMINNFPRGKVILRDILLEEH